MKKILLAFLVVLVLFSSPAYTKPVYASPMRISDTFYQNYVAFSINSFQEIDSESNLLYSPVSLYYVLGMMSVFSSDETYTEFQSLLGVDKETLLSQIPILTTDVLIDHEDADYWFQNFLYYDNQTNIGLESYVFNETLLTQYQETFNYELSDILFYNGDASRQIANRITEGTNHFLELVEDDFASLINANIMFNNTIYYKGKWSVEFEEKDNYDDDFYNFNQDSATVEYMEKEDTSSKFYTTENAKALKSYFRDGSSMTYILPNGDYSITDLVNNTETITDVITNQENYQRAETTLTIPKMEMNNKLTLNDSMKSLGLTSIFTESETTFPALSPYPFGITEIWQVAKIRVDESGVEVAASTFSVGCAATAPLEPYEFKVDQPFIYVIMSPTDIPLFIGVIYNL